MSLPARSALTVIVICLVACGSGGGGQPGGGSHSTLTVSPQTASTTIGGAVVSLTARLSGSSNPISWTLNGAGSLAPSTGPTTQYTPPAFGGTPVTATVTATAGSGLSASVTVQVAVPAAIDVSGRVIGGDLMPISGMGVTIGAQSVVTDADGRFTIANVPPPYDLTAFRTAPRKLGIVYQGLTRRDPTILVVGNGSGPTVAATLTGNVTGGNPPGTAGDRTQVLFASPQVPDSLVNEAQTAVLSNPYSLHPTWVGPGPTTGTVQALQWQIDSSGNPVSFSGYAKVEGVTLTDGGTTTADLVMSPPSASRIAGTIQLAPGVSGVGQFVDLILPGAVPVIMGTDHPSGSFSYALPALDGATATLVTAAAYAGSNQSTAVLAGVPLGTTNLVVNLATPCTPIAPLHYAMDVTTATDFSWTPMSGTTYQLYVYGYSNALPFYVVYTTATSAKIPDLTAAGLPLPPSGAFGWNVNAYGPVDSVDELAGAALPHLRGVDSYFGCSTAPRDFFTPPP